MTATPGMSAAVGGLLWCAVALAWLVGAIQLDLVRLLLALAVLVIVPLGLGLHRDARPPLPTVAMVTGALSAAAILMEQGALTGLLVVPSIAMEVAFAGWALWSWWRRRGSLLELSWVAVAGYLAVGGVWLALDRFAIEPVGIRAPFVALTAIHFHYAGFAGGLIATLLHRAVAGRRTARIAMVLVIVSP